MKDILNIMRFDFLTAKTTALPIFVVIAVMCNALGLLFSPMMFVYVLMAASFLIVQLQTYAEKYGFHKLYGILPINRKSITRGRFQYIFWTFFAVEIFELIMTKLALVLKLYRILSRPAPSSPRVQDRCETVSSLARRYSLTRREEEVLTQLMSGKDLDDIGKELFITVATLRKHISSIYHKADVHSRQQLMALVSPPTPPDR